MAITVPIQLRSGTAAQWTAANPILLLGEPGYETDTGREKRGNGTSAWNSLPYFTPGGTADLSGGIDGGAPTSVYGGTTAVDGGTP